MRHEINTTNYRTQKKNPSFCRTLLAGTQDEENEEEEDEIVFHNIHTPHELIDINVYMQITYTTRDLLFWGENKIRFFIFLFFYLTSMKIWGRWNSAGWEGWDVLPS